MIFPNLGSLVIFSPNRGYGYRGVVVGKTESEIKVYRFDSGDTYNLTSGPFLPFTESDYQQIDKQNYWQGLIVKMPDSSTGIVQGGKYLGKSSVAIYIRLSIQNAHGIIEYHELQAVSITGHVHAKI